MAEVSSRDTKDRRSVAGNMAQTPSSNWITSACLKRSVLTICGLVLSVSGSFLAGCPGLSIHCTPVLIASILSLLGRGKKATNASVSTVKLNVIPHSAGGTQSNSAQVSRHQSGTASRTPVWQKPLDLQCTAYSDTSEPERTFAAGCTSATAARSDIVLKPRWRLADPLQEKASGKEQAHPDTRSQASASCEWLIADRPLRWRSIPYWRVRIMTILC